MQFFCLIQHQNFVFQLNFENRRVRTTQLGHGTRRRPEFIDNEEVCYHPDESGHGVE